MKEGELLNRINSPWPQPRPSRSSAPLYARMSSIQLLNPNADVARRAQALQITVNAAHGLQSVLKTNLGPKGTLKM